MVANKETSALFLTEFSSHCILPPYHKLSTDVFSKFDEVHELARSQGISFEFCTPPDAPKYPTECLKFFQHQRRVTYELLTPQLSTLATLKVTKQHIREFYSTSLRLNSECGDIKVIDAFLISELNDNKPIYIFFFQGYLRACSEGEALSFLEYSNAVKAYQLEAEKFSVFSSQVQKAVLKAKTDNQAAEITSILNVGWRGVFAVQHRMLHDQNYCGIQKRTTVSHIRLLNDYKNGRMSRTSGQTLCGAKSKFGYSDDFSDQSSYFVTCPKCLQMVNLGH